MEIDQIRLQETYYGKGFKGTLKDLLRDVFESAKKNTDQDFEDNEYSKISIDSITIT